MDQILLARKDRVIYDRITKIVRSQCGWRLVYEMTVPAAVLQISKKLHRLRKARDTAFAELNDLQRQIEETVEETGLLASVRKACCGLHWCCFLLSCRWRKRKTFPSCHR